MNLSDDDLVLGLQRRVLRLEHDLEGERRARHAEGAQAFLSRMYVEQQLSETASRVPTADRTPEDLRAILAWSPTNREGMHGFDFRKYQERVRDLQEKAAEWRAMGRLVSKTVDWEAVAREELNHTPDVEAQLDVDLVTEALHPTGGGPTVDCCMGSTVRNVHGEVEGERLHRKYHREDAEAFVTVYARLLRETRR